jgi:uncharacterized protein
MDCHGGQGRLAMTGDGTSNPTGKAMHMDIAFSACGFLVGGLVGLTGIGGGSIMTPLLILLFGVHPLAAAGTDLLYAAVTKATGARVHAQRGNVEWKIVGLLAMGSVPGTLATIFLMMRLPMRSPELTHVVTVSIGIALVLAAAGLLLGHKAERFAAKIARIEPAGPASASSKLTVLLGLLLGIVVTLTSVGAGAIGIAILRVLHPRLSAVRLVGSDIAHAVPLTLIAGTGHWLLGDIKWAMLASLLIGSIPGIYLASRYAHQIPDGILRRLLAGVLLAVAAPMMAS